MAMTIYDQKKGIVVAGVYSEQDGVPEAAIKNFNIGDGWPRTLAHGEILSLGVTFDYAGPSQSIVLEGFIFKGQTTYVSSKAAIAVPESGTEFAPCSGEVNIEIPGKPGFFGGGIPDGVYDVGARLIGYEGQATDTISNAITVSGEEVTPGPGLLDSIIMTMVMMMMMGMIMPMMED